MCCSSDGVRSKRSEVRAVGWRAGRDRRWAAAKVRPAVAAVRAVVLLAPWMRLVDGVAQAEPVDGARRGDAVERPQPDGHAALGDVR